MKTEIATFAAGCFWSIEYAFNGIEGVKGAPVGYTGGHTEDPTYEGVSSGKTGHAEAVEVTFDPDKVSYRELLDAFWSMHDPTTLNKQGPDVGEQYRSAIFFHTEKQKKLALEMRKELDESGKFSDPIVTEIIQAGTFYRAEEYHQKYFEKNPDRIGSCHTLNYGK